MYIVDDIAYAGEVTPLIKVRGVRPLDNYELWVRFRDSVLATWHSTLGNSVCK